MTEHWYPVYLQSVFLVTFLSGFTEIKLYQCSRSFPEIQIKALKTHKHTQCLSSLHCSSFVAYSLCHAFYFFIQHFAKIVVFSFCCQQTCPCLWLVRHSFHMNTILARLQNPGLTFQVDKQLCVPTYPDCFTIMLAKPNKTKPGMLNFLHSTFLRRRFGKHIKITVTWFVKRKLANKFKNIYIKMKHLFYSMVS